MSRVAVIGAGVVGLSTAVRIQRHIPGADVTIIADKFDKDTTSDGAAGIFRPTTSMTTGVPVPLLRQWMRDSWDHYCRLANSREGNEAGCLFLSGYQFYNDSDKHGFDEEPLKDIVHNFRTLTDDDMEIFPQVGYKHGCFMTTVMTECRRYLPYLMRKFLSAGGKVENRKVTDLKEKAVIERQWVGLRPCWEVLRLEKELMTFPEGQLKVVHNYGHGGDGV